MEQRYEPLPSLAGLPGWLWRRTPGWARVVVAGLAVMAVAGIVAFVA
nr:hypothetical protein [Solirubrobacterales bacterium]